MTFYNYFDFSRCDNPYNLFLIYNGFQPTVSQIFPDYSSYSKAQRIEIKKQFERDFSVWRESKKISYAPGEYIEAAASLLPQIQILPKHVRRTIAERVLAAAENTLKESRSQAVAREGCFLMKHIKTRKQAALCVANQLQGVASWKELKSYFQSEQPHWGDCPDRIREALNVFDKKKMRAAMEENLFDLRHSDLIFDFKICLILECLNGHSIRKILFNSVLDSYECWFETIYESFPLSIHYYLTGKTSKYPFADAIPGEKFIAKLLAYIRLNPSHEKLSISISFKKRLFDHLQTNVNFAQYVTEQVIRYAVMLRDQEGIRFYPPLRKMIKEFNLAPIIESLRKGEQDLHYISQAVFEEFLGLPYQENNPSLYKINFSLSSDRNHHKDFVSRHTESSEG